MNSKLIVEIRNDVDDYSKLIVKIGKYVNE